jgi:hypothetical protein
MDVPEVGDLPGSQPREGPYPGFDYPRFVALSGQEIQVVRETGSDERQTAGAEASIEH